MKRIFILNDKAAGGGAEAVMRDIVKHLHEKHEISVMTLDDDYASFQKAFPQDVKYIPSRIKANPYRRRNPLHYLVAIYNRLRIAQIQSQKYDVVIANKEGPCMKIVSRMKAAKKLAWVHVDYMHLYWTRWFFGAGKELKCMKRFDNVVCVSQAAANSVKMVIGDPGNLCVKYNPIDYSAVIKKAEDQNQVERDVSKPLFVAVGRFVEQKNFITLAKVCARLSREFDFELWLVGDGDQRPQVEDILNREKCDCVKILGWQDNPYKYLAKADFLLNVSLSESYGLVLQESLLLGVPVFTTSCPAIEECFDSRFGLLVDPEEAAIETGMRCILENPECIAVYRKRIKEEYDREALWEQRLLEIEKLI